MTSVSVTIDVDQPEYTPQQRAAKVVYQLTLRALAGLDGLTTRQVATMVGLSWDGAHSLLCNVSGSGIPIYDAGGKWALATCHLKIAQGRLN